MNLGRRERTEAEPQARAALGGIEPAVAAGGHEGALAGAFGDEARSVERTGNPREKAKARGRVLELKPLDRARKRLAEGLARRAVSRSHALEVREVLPRVDEPRKRALDKGRAADVVGDLEREEPADERRFPGDARDPERGQEAL